MKSFKWILLAVSFLALPLFADQDVDADRAVSALNHGNYQAALYLLQHRSDYNYAGHAANAVQYLQQALQAEHAGDLNAAQRYAAQASMQMNMARQAQPTEIDRSAHVQAPQQHSWH